MGRQNYMTITVHDTVQIMFDEFIRIKGITKTADLNDVVEMYMLAKVEELYFERQSLPHYGYLLVGTRPSTDERRPDQTAIKQDRLAGVQPKGNLHQH